MSHTLSDISVGDSHSCALRADGSAVCRGSNGRGQSSPPYGEVFSSITSGTAHTCAVRRDSGTVVCWGDTFGGRGRTSTVHGSPPHGQGFSANSSGHEHTCGLTPQNSLICWGLGYDVESPQYSPVPGAGFVAVSSGRNHTCALKGDGSPQCWGDDTEGQASPPPGLLLTDVGSNHEYTCGLRADGTAVCWGLDRFGRATPPPPLGSGSRTSAWEPTTPAGLSRTDRRYAGAPTRMAVPRRRKAGLLLPSAPAMGTPAAWKGMAKPPAGKTTLTGRPTFQKVTYSSQLALEPSKLAASGQTVLYGAVEATGCRGRSLMKNGSSPSAAEANTYAVCERMTLPYAGPRSRRMAEAFRPPTSGSRR